MIRDTNNRKFIYNKLAHNQHVKEVHVVEDRESEKTVTGFVLGAHARQIYVYTYNELFSFIFRKMQQFFVFFANFLP